MNLDKFLSEVYRRVGKPRFFDILPADVSIFPDKELKTYDTCEGPITIEVRTVGFKRRYAHNRLLLRWYERSRDIHKKRCVEDGCWELYTQEGYKRRDALAEQMYDEEFSFKWSWKGVKYNVTVTKDELVARDMKTEAVVVRRPRTYYCHG